MFVGYNEGQSPNCVPFRQTYEGPKIARSRMIIQLYIVTKEKQSTI